MVWIHYLTKLAMQSGVNPTISTVRKNITSLMFTLNTRVDPKVSRLVPPSAQQLC